MTYIVRLLKANIDASLERGKSVFLLGPRQTGKTTLTAHIKADKRFTLANTADRLRYEKDPVSLTAEVEALSLGKMKPLIIIDEIQKIPLLMDAVQDLIDRKIAQFIVTGSSARKLRRGENINLLPGRVMLHRLDPLCQKEYHSLDSDLSTLLLDGTLPEIFLEKERDEREKLLEAYVTIYLEEEIRAEALVRNLGHFARFLELAASESGNIVNFSKLSQEIGVNHSTIMGYYQILEDCLITERVEPIIYSKTRRKLSKTQKYLFYDLGVRRIAAREGHRLSLEQMGRLFEQYIGLEIIRFLRLNHPRFLLKYWRDLSGAEVDWVIDTGEELIPIEVKWTTAPSLQDAKHLQTFLNEYPAAKQGFIICQTPHPLKISDIILALNWRDLERVF